MVKISFQGLGMVKQITVAQEAAGSTEDITIRGRFPARAHDF